MPRATDSGSSVDSASKENPNSTNPRLEPTPRKQHDAFVAWNCSAAARSRTATCTSAAWLAARASASLARGVLLLACGGGGTAAVAGASCARLTCGAARENEMR